MTPRRAPIGALKLREGLDGNGATCPPTAAGVFRTAASYGAEVSVRRATDRMPLRRGFAIEYATLAWNVAGDR